MTDEWEKTIELLENVETEDDLYKVIPSMWSPEGWWAAVVFEAMQRRIKKMQK